jgi:hypothetical protein
LAPLARNRPKKDKNTTTIDINVDFLARRETSVGYGKDFL